MRTCDQVAMRELAVAWSTGGGAVARGFDLPVPSTVLHRERGRDLVALALVEIALLGCGDGVLQVIEAARPDNRRAHARRERGPPHREIDPVVVRDGELHRLHPLPVVGVLVIRPRPHRPDRVRERSLGNHPEPARVRRRDDGLQVPLVEQVDRAFDGSEPRRAHGRAERGTLARVACHLDLPRVARALERLEDVLAQRRVSRARVEEEQVDDVRAERPERAFDTPDNRGVGSHRPRRSAPYPPFVASTNSSRRCARYRPMRSSARPYDRAVSIGVTPASSTRRGSSSACSSLTSSPPIPPVPRPTAETRNPVAPNGRSQHRRSRLPAFRRVDTRGVRVRHGTGETR